MQECARVLQVPEVEADGGGVGGGALRARRDDDGREWRGADDAGARAERVGAGRRARLAHAARHAARRRARRRDQEQLVQARQVDRVRPSRRRRPAQVRVRSSYRLYIEPKTFYIYIIS